MEHIKIKTEKQVEWHGLEISDFSKTNEFWMGTLLMIPNLIELIKETDYSNNRVLTWYEKQVENHDNVMKEFKRIFRWQKK